MWSAIGTVAGTLIGGALQSAGQRDANRANAQMAADQMAFQERMSNSAHQREVADLKAAGLNPILSVNSGASTPPGAASTMGNELEGIGASAREATQMAMALRKQKEEIELLKAQKGKTKAEEELTRKMFPRKDVENSLWTNLLESFKNLSSTAAKGVEVKSKSMPLSPKWNEELGGSYLEKWRRETVEQNKRKVPVGRPR